MTTPQQSAYAASYIRAALTDLVLAAPDRTQANGTMEALVSIYEAHRAGGTDAARHAWETVKRFKPDMAALESNQSLLLYAAELKSITKPEVQLEGYPFYRYGFNLLVGPSGSGKSFVALDYAGRVAQERLVVYIVGEGLHGYAGRWEAWKDFTGGNDGKMYFYREAVQLVDETRLRAFIDLVGPRQPELIIVDTFARCAVGVEENSARDVGMFVEACDTLRRELNTGLLVVHHTGNNGRIRGSSALYAAADAVLFQSKIEGRISLSNHEDYGGKNKHDQAMENRYMRIVPREVGEFEGAVLMPDVAVIQHREDRLSANQRAILEALDGHDKGMSPKSLMDATSLGSSSFFYALKALLKLKYVEQNDDERYLLCEEGIDILVGLQ